MENVSTDVLTWAVHNGVAGVLLIVLVGLGWAFKSGWIRSKYEVMAWQDRAEHDEKLLDEITPALNRLSDSQQRSTDLIDRVLLRHQ